MERKLLNCQQPLEVRIGLSFGGRNKSKQSLLELLFMFYSLFGAFAAIDYYVVLGFRKRE
ncbi:MAG: hypothetical protein AUG83_03750 [Acidobacteria bacterium 13_1_20CM_4_57_11]|nr:MAG: hypothetical protein AUG83_03750 [Acidobacteria bacterium 13_1_20CM_4_57_11]